MNPTLEDLKNGDDCWRVGAIGKLVRLKKMKDTPLTDDEEIIINGDYNRYVYSGFARELERENNRLKKQVAELTEMLIEVRDNPNNNIFEKFEKGKSKNYGSNRR